MNESVSQAIELIEQAKERTNSMRELINQLVTLLVQVGEKCQIQDNDSLELVQFKAELITWLAKEFPEMN